MKNDQAVNDSPNYAELDWKTSFGDAPPALNGHLQGDGWQNCKNSTAYGATPNDNGVEAGTAMVPPDLFNADDPYDPSNYEAGAAPPGAVIQRSTTNQHGIYL